MKFSEIERAMFGEHVVSKPRPTSDATVSISLVYQSEEESAAKFSLLQKRQLIRQDSVVPLTELNREMKRSLCSKSFHITAGFQYIENYLKKELIRRRKTKHPFTELELTRIFYDAIDGYATLQQAGMKVGEINPALLWVYDDPTLKLQRIKVIERWSLAKDQRTNLMNAMTSGLDLYMDPLVFVCLFNNTMKPLAEINNQAKVDAFSLGMVLLEAGILESVQPVYDTQKGAISEDKLAIFLKKFFMLYGDSSLISNWVTRMVARDWRQRPDFAEVRAGLPNWYQVKVAIDIGQSDSFAGGHGMNEKTSPSSGGMDNISNASYGVGHAVTPPVTLSLGDDKGKETGNEVRGRGQVRNDFEIDPMQFVPLPVNTMKVEANSQAKPVAKPGQMIETTSVLQAPAPTRVTSPEKPSKTPEAQKQPEPEFDFFNFVPDSEVKKSQAINAYIQQEPNDFPSQNFSSFKVVPSDLYSHVKAPDHGPAQADGQPSLALPPHPSPNQAEPFVSGFGGIPDFYNDPEEEDLGLSKAVNQYLGKDTPNQNVFYTEPYLDNPKGPNGGQKNNLLGNGLLSVINDKDKLGAGAGSSALHPKPVNDPLVASTDSKSGGNFSGFFENIQMESQAQSQPPEPKRVPKNDFRSGVSDLVEAQEASKVGGQAKMTLSSYIKMNLT